MSRVLRVLAVVAVIVAAGAAANDGPRRIFVLDDCDPTDDEWMPTGGCVKADGEVTFLEFFTAAPIGHPAWRNEPSYLKMKPDKNVDVINGGGRDHTFTEVADYAGGVVPPLNLPNQAVAPECADFANLEATLLPPGAKMRLERLEAGTHKYQCCFHPWMRAELRVR